MSRNEFIEILKNNMTTLDESVVFDKLKYYNDYIDAEISKGRTEEDVINELGDPRLIAKTIKEVTDDSYKTILETGESKEDSFNKKTKSQYNRNTGNNNSSYNNGSPYYYQTSGIGCVIAMLVVFIIVMAVLRFFGMIAVTSIKFAYASPIAFCIIILLVYFLFGSRRQ